ncbi:hypothetical protein PINS_up003029 [Pythium insidiosum]|nr:hypothetical protein PINS_up003029 [Pythium insidiosum]
MQISRDGQQWIMWRTSSIQLLTEIPHYTSSSCEQPQADVEEPADQTSGVISVDGATDDGRRSVDGPDVQPQEFSPRPTIKDSSTFEDIASPAKLDTKTEDSRATDPAYHNDFERNLHPLRENDTITEVSPTADSPNEDSLHRHCHLQISCPESQHQTNDQLDHKPDVADTVMEECESKREVIGEVILENNEPPAASYADVCEPPCQLDEADEKAKLTTERSSSEDQDGHKCEINDTVSSHDLDGEPEMEIVSEAAPVWSWDERPLNVGRKVDESTQTNAHIVATASWDDRPLNIGRNNPFNTFYADSLKHIDNEFPDQLNSASSIKNVIGNDLQEEKSNVDCPAPGNEVICGESLDESDSRDDGAAREKCKPPSPDEVDNVSQKSTEEESDIVPSEGSAANDSELEPKIPVQRSPMEADQDWSWDDAPIKSRFLVQQTKETYVEDSDEVQGVEVLEQSTSPERLSEEFCGDGGEGRSTLTIQPVQVVTGSVQLAAGVDDGDERRKCATESVELVLRFNDDDDMKKGVTIDTSAVAIRSTESSHETDAPNHIDMSGAVPTAAFCGAALDDDRSIPLEPGCDTEFASKREDEGPEHMADEEMAEDEEVHDDSISAKLSNSPLITTDHESSNVQHDHDGNLCEHSTRTLRFGDEMEDTEEQQETRLEIMESRSEPSIRRDDMIHLDRHHESDSSPNLAVSTLNRISDMATRRDACEDENASEDSDMGGGSSHEMEDEVDGKLNGIRAEASPISRAAVSTGFSVINLAPEVSKDALFNAVRRRVDTAPNTRTASKLYTAIKTGDNPDDVLRALADESTEFDGWLRYEPPSLLTGQSSFQQEQNLLDVLYSRNGSNDPFSTPTKQRPGTVQATRTPNTSTPRERLTALLGRTPSKQTHANAHGLIMGTGEPEQILAAQFGKSSDELDLFSGYVYPELSTSRAFSTSSVSGDERPSSPAMKIPTIERASSFSSPLPSKGNPLKRTASAIAKTPPVAVAKSDNTPSRLADPTIPTTASRDSGVSLAAISSTTDASDDEQSGDGTTESSRAGIFSSCTTDEVVDDKPSTPIRHRKWSSATTSTAIHKRASDQSVRRRTEGIYNSRGGY